MPDKEKEDNTRFPKFKINLPHIGMRKVKSILAIFVSFCLWQLLRLIFPDLEEHPIYMYIYSMIEIRDRSEKTISLGSKRIKATITAICIGLPILAVFDLVVPLVSAEGARIAVEVAFLLAGVLLTLLIAEAVGCKAMCGLAAAIFIILFVSHSDDRRYVYSALRAFQTIFGVLVAWFINVKLFPYPGKKAQA